MRKEMMQMREIIRLEPVFKQMVWGGSGLRDYFGYEIPGEDTGEAWVVSAHPQGDCRVAEGALKERPCPSCGRRNGLYLAEQRGRSSRCW